MTILFMFGAGASFGCGGCVPCQPPLGNGLFDELRKLNGYCATVTPTHVLQAFRQDFEQGMELLLDFDEFAAPLVQREIAEFLTHFEPTEATCYVHLPKSIRANLIDAIVATINYDYLIEHSAWLAGFRYAHYYDMTYSNDTVRILKPHGSVNFIPENAGTDMTFKNNRVSYKVIGKMKRAFATNYIPARLGPTRAFLRNRKRDDPPEMAFYMREKFVPFGGGPFGGSFPGGDTIETHQRLWGEHVAIEGKLFMVGVRLFDSPAHDPHLWGCLASTPRPIYYVGDADSYSVLNRLAKTTTSYLGPFFQDALPELIRLMMSP